MTPAPGSLDARPSGLDDRHTMKELVGRLSRIEGQVRGICRMINERRPCIEVMQQLAAAESALGRIGSFVFKSHVDTCVRTGAADSAVADGRDLDGLLGLVSTFEKLSTSTPSESRGQPARNRS